MKFFRISALASAGLIATGALVGAVGTGEASADTFTVVQFISWNGSCLSIPTASAGVRLDTVPCGSDHHWWVDPAGFVFPQGHPNVEVGDSGGFLELKATGTGTPVFSDAFRTGANGNLYRELWFNVGGTYWHANGGNGQDVTLDSEQGDLANYYEFNILPS